MKLKTISSIIAVLVIASFSFATSSFAKESKYNEIKTIQDELIFLLKNHSRYINSFLSKQNFNNFDKAFFADIAFIKENRSTNFLHNIEKRIANNTKSIITVSYTSFSSINGVYKAVHYNYKNNGGNIIISKETNNNGKILKALYNYNSKDKLLETKEYKDKNLIVSKKHSIKA